MAWSYRKRIKIVPGIHLNLSKKGISTTIGVRGVNLNLGNNGIYANMGIPGTGIYSRRKISSKKPIASNSFSNSPMAPDNSPFIKLDDNIFSADIHEITSSGMQGIKEAILTVQNQKTDLIYDLEKVKKECKRLKLKLNVSYFLLYGFLLKEKTQQTKQDISSQHDVIEKLEELIDSCFVDLNVDIDQDINSKYENLIHTFDKLSGSNKIWDVIREEFHDRRVTRSAASRSVTRREISFGRKHLIDIQCETEPLYLRNANGGDLYIYPNFIVMFSSQKEFAVVGLNEIILHHSDIRFVEEERVPHDTKVIDRTWAKVNKNGTPDRRFKGNYEIPIVRYGRLMLSTQTGMREEYQFSSYEASAEFAKAFQAYQNELKN
jgi:hypothetical protein